MKTKINTTIPRALTQDLNGYDKTGCIVQVAYDLESGKWHWEVHASRNDRVEWREPAIIDVGYYYNSPKRAGLLNDLKSAIVKCSHGATYNGRYGDDYAQAVAKALVKACEL